MKLKISLDLDGVVVDFDNHYLTRFNPPKSNYEITKNVHKLRKDSEFWLQQPLIHYPNFMPHCYCTARIISKNLIKKQLELNELPKAPIYQIFGYSLSKVPQLKRAKCDVHIDDSLKNFINLNLNGIPCLLMDTDINKNWGPIGRVYSLDKEEIEEVYNLFINTIFPYFKNFID